MMRMDLKLAMTTLRIGWLPLAVAMLTCAPLAIAAETETDAKPDAKKPAAAAGADSLDKELLKQLGDDPLAEDLIPARPAEKPADKGADKGAKKKGDAPKPGRDEGLDQQLLDGLMEGEDLGESEDPLMRIGRQMRQAGGLIGQTKSGGPTQELQKRIVTDLEKLIQQARQQQQQQSSSSSQQKTARREQVKQSQPSSSPGNRDASNEPAKDSTEKLGKSDVRKPDMGQMNDLIKDIWGQLPERQREQMMQSSMDQFLPKYELLIEEYFKALVERQKEKPSR